MVPTVKELVQQVPRTSKHNDKLERLTAIRELHSTGGTERSNRKNPYLRLDCLEKFLGGTKLLRDGWTNEGRRAGYIERAQQACPVLQVTGVFQEDG